MSKKLKLGTTIPADTFFYTIPFEQPGQKLTRKILEKHYLVPNGRRAHMGIHTEYKAFKNGIVSVIVKAPDNSENVLFLHVGLNDLDVACTCGMPDKRLCYHAYKGLHSLAWRDYLELDQYYWPGIMSDDRIRNKFLVTEVTKNWISIKSKFKYGNLFKSMIGFDGGEDISIKKTTRQLEIIAGGQEEISYCLAYNVGNRSNSLLPILTPCLGVTSKNNKEIVNFNQFGIPGKPIGNFTYTSNQQALNDISYKQYHIAKAYNEFANEEKNNAFTDAKQNIITLWEQAIPLLLNEKYNYRYYTYWLKYLKDKPRKAEMRNCRYSSEKPVLSFILKYHQDHFSLTPVVTVNGDVLKFNYKPHLFIFDDITELCYLMPSVQDDDLLMWVVSNNKRLTILKEDFAEFHNVFLSNVSSCYTVKFIDPNSPKSIPYNYDLIANNLK